MTPERWEEVKAVLHAALERPPRERGVFVEAACSTDPALRREVDSLLAAHDGATDQLPAHPLRGLVDAVTLRHASIVPREGGNHLVRRRAVGGC